MAAGQIYAEAESRANRFAMPRRNRINGASATNIRKIKPKNYFFFVTIPLMWDFSVLFFQKNCLAL